jgi:hypothetical protein
MHTIPNRSEWMFRALVVLMLGVCVYQLGSSRVRPDPCTGADVQHWIERARAQGFDLPAFEHRSEW